MQILPAVVQKIANRDRLLGGLMTRRDTRGFTRWIEDYKREWPQRLHDAGIVAQLSLATLYQPAADKSDSFVAANKRDIAGIVLLYREYRAIGRHRLALPAPSTTP